MPAFTFEKISPPPRTESPPPISPAHRSRLARLVDRLTEMRLRSGRAADREQGVTSQNNPKVKRNAKSR